MLFRGENGSLPSLKASGETAAGKELDHPKFQDSLNSANCLATL